MSSTNSPEIGTPLRARVDQEQDRPVVQSRQDASLFEMLRSDYGDAFDAYVEHLWNDTPVTNLREQFVNRYWASFPDRKTFIDTVIDHLGWADAYNDIHTRYAIPEHILNWNYPLLYERLSEDYTFLDRGGNVHVFHT